MINMKSYSKPQLTALNYELYRKKHGLMPHFINSELSKTCMASMGWGDHLK